MATVAKIRESMLRDALAELVAQAGQIGYYITPGQVDLEHAMRHCQRAGLELRAIAELLQAEHAQLPIAKEPT